MARNNCEDAKDSVFYVLLSLSLHGRVLSGRLIGLQLVLY